MITTDQTSTLLGVLAVSVLAGAMWSGMFIHDKLGGKVRVDYTRIPEFCPYVGDCLLPQLANIEE